MKSEIFFPPNDDTLINLPEFVAHYHDVYGRDLTREEISAKIYGGKPLNEKYKSVEFVADDEQLKKSKGDIILESNEAGLPDLIISNVSLRQFLVIGLPYLRFGTSGLPFEGQWNEVDRWDDLEQQYRLELCHSEVSRWSIFFKKDGKRVKGLQKKQISGDEDIVEIELVNNCTTSTGFEFRIKFRGDDDPHHGSFGRDHGVSDVYQALSIHQAGSWAKQWSAGLVGMGSEPSFGFFSGTDIYGNFAGWSGLANSTVQPGAGEKQNTIDISMERYLDGAKVIADSIDESCVKTHYEKIDYCRWGDNSEYFKKSHDRRLMMSIQTTPEESSRSVEIPITYREIFAAHSIRLPDFPPRGIYDMNNPQSKRGYGRLSEMRKAVFAKLSNGCFWLELRRQGCDQSFEFRRIVFGNLNLKAVPLYDADSPEDSFLTIHRFGYGARSTNMEYKKKFELPHGEKSPPHFAYLLAGDSSDAESANSYICPESFGVERAIFTWESPTILAIDLISFERILPVWQGRIEFPDGYVDRQDFA